MHSKTTFTCAVLFCGLLISACTTTPIASPTPYKQARANDGYGYSSVQLTNSEYRVLFKATDRTPADIVQQYALRRAAEIAKQNNYAWLAIVKTHVDKKPVTARAMSVNTDTVEPFSANQQCTMSGCSEVAQPMPSQGQAKIETLQINDVYFSILVRMGPTLTGLGKNALSVDKILANRADEAL